MINYFNIVDSSEVYCLLHPEERFKSWIIDIDKHGNRVVSKAMCLKCCAEIESLKNELKDAKELYEKK